MVQIAMQITAKDITRHSFKNSSSVTRWVMAHLTVNLVYSVVVSHRRSPLGNKEGGVSTCVSACACMHGGKWCRQCRILAAVLIVLGEARPGCNRIRIARKPEPVSSHWKKGRTIHHGSTAAEWMVQHIWLDSNVWLAQFGWQLIHSVYPAQA